MRGVRAVADCAQPIERRGIQAGGAAVGSAAGYAAADLETEHGAG